MRGREFLAHAERVAARKTPNLRLNAAMAPPGRIHPGYGRVKSSFDLGHALKLSRSWLPATRAEHPDV